MSITSEVAKTNANRINIINAVNDKGGTLADNAPLSAVPSAIASLPSGGESHGLVWGALQTEAFEWTEEMKSEAGALSKLGKLGTIMRNSKLTGKLDLSNITTFYAEQGFLGSSGITEIDLSNVTLITNMCYAFQNCGKIDLVDMSSLTSITTSGVSSSFRKCTIKMFKTHPAALGGIHYLSNILFNGGFINGVRLTAIAENDIHLDCSNYIVLGSDSILDVLQHLSTQTEGLTCTFSNYNSTIKKSDANYDAIVALAASLTNWTINNLKLEE